jgi:hypothetical protein
MAGWQGRVQRHASSGYDKGEAVRACESRVFLQVGWDYGTKDLRLVFDDFGGHEWDGFGWGLCR